jgi:hypothetical protein
MIKYIRMGRAGRAVRVGDNGKSVQIFPLKGKSNRVDILVDIDGSIILKWTLRSRRKALSRFFWLRIETTDGFLLRW